MIRKWILFLLIIVILPGCASTKFNSKTVVIPDTEAVPELAHSNGEFGVKKIYRLFENQKSEMYILGWSDDENIIIRNRGDDVGQTLQRVDYKNEALKTIKSLDLNIEASMVSPDGRYVSVYAWDKERNRSMKFYSLIDNTTTTIEHTEHLMTDTMTWSNNSRYLSFIYWDEQMGGESLAVYDVSAKKLKRYAIPNEGEKSWVRYSKISDNGETALIVKQMFDGQSLLFGKLEDSGIVALYRHLLNQTVSVDFLNNDQILFVSENNLLFAYDRRNKATAILSEQVGTFRLTRDRKYIAYSKDFQNTYIAKLQGNNLLNEQEIFKGMNPEQMEWNPSGDKLYLNGWKSFDARNKGTVAVMFTMHYVIEFE